MQHKSLLIRVTILWLCIAPVAASAQTATVSQSVGESQKVDAYVRERMAALHIPGLSVVVLRGGQIVFAEGYGKSNLELGTPATENTAVASGTSAAPRASPPLCLASSTTS